MTATFRTSQIVSDIEVGKPHLILVGLPGAGKSAVGEALGERLNRSFLDFDREIELTLELRQYGNMIVAPGGGWVTNKGVVEIIRPPAKLVYLKVKAETALKRLGDQRAARPLLSRPDPLGELRRLLVEREPLYGQSDHVISTEVLDIKRVVDKLAELASTIKGT